MQHRLAAPLSPCAERTQPRSCRHLTANRAATRATAGPRKTVERCSIAA